MRKLSCLVVLLFVALPAFSQEKTDPNQKYRLRVLLRCGAHRWLSEQFRDDLCGTLGSTMQDALGGMADVEVLDLKRTADDQWEKWWRDVDTKGLAAVDAVAEPTGDKTHFLRIDYRNGRYELQSRQIDASTGLVSPLRRDHTDDRAFVARLAGRMLAQDFGIVGALEGQGDKVTVAFKGGAISEALSRWVQKGSVFEVAYLTTARAGAGSKVSRMPERYYTVVQLLQDPVGGKAPAKVVYRPEKNPLTIGGSAGFRCLKLPTTAGLLRVRILDEKGLPHAQALQIRVHSQAFQTDISPEEEVITPDSTGMFISKQNYENLAFVRVVTGARLIARLPVPIYGDRAATFALNIDPAAEALGQLLEAKRNLEQQHNEALLVQVERRKSTEALMNSGKIEEALNYVKASRRTLEQDVDRLSAQVASLKKEIGSHPVPVEVFDQYAEAFTVRKSGLNRLIFDLQDAVDVANSPERKAKEFELKSLFAKAQLHETNFDIDQAISVYEQIEKKFGVQKVVTDRLTKLKAEWAIKSDAHRAAREFVYGDWLKVKTAADAEAKLPKARESLQALKQAGDQLSLYKLRNSLPELVKALTTEIAQVTQSENPEDEPKKAKLKKFGEAFDKFAQEVDAALAAKKT